MEATVGGEHVEYLIADADGAILGTEVSIELAQLPEPVRVAAEKYFGTTSGLKAMKGGRIRRDALRDRRAEKRQDG